MTIASLAAVLDTNVLHYVRLYLKYARAGGRYPYDGVGWDETRSKIKDDEDEAPLIDCLKKGGQCLFFLKERGVYVLRCPAAELELIRLHTRGRAMGAARASPLAGERLWTRFGEASVNYWLTQDDHRDVVSELEGVFDTLGEFGIAVSPVSGVRKRESLDATLMAREIMEVVYMEPLDCIVYAHALVTGATHLLTGDEGLRRAAHRLRHPNGGRHEVEMAVSDAVLRAVRVVTGTEDLGRVDFPECPKISRLEALVGQP